MGGLFRLVCFEDDELDAVCFFIEGTAAAPDELIALMLLGGRILLEATGEGTELDGAVTFFFGGCAFVT
jgi:hypothetical protein